MVAAIGEIDLSNVDDFERVVASAVEQAARTGDRVTVDLSSVEYLDSAAINALCAHGEQIRVLAPRLLKSTLTMSGLTELVDVEFPAHED